MCLLCHRYNRRQIALRIAYLGEAYQGFAIQEPPAITVEVSQLLLFLFFCCCFLLSVVFFVFFVCLLAILYSSHFYLYLELSVGNLQEDSTHGGEGQLL